MREWKVGVTGLAPPCCPPPPPTLPYMALLPNSVTPTLLSALKRKPQPHSVGQPSTLSTPTRVPGCSTAVNEVMVVPADKPDESDEVVVVVAALAELLPLLQQFINATAVPTMTSGGWAMHPT